MMSYLHHAFDNAKKKVTYNFYSQLQKALLTTENFTVVQTLHDAADERIREDATYIGAV